MSAQQAPEEPESGGLKATNPRKLDTVLVQGLRVTGLTSVGLQIAAWAATLMIARLLKPSDYGLIAMASVYLELARLLSEAGLGTAVLTMPDIKGKQLEEINSVALLLGVAVALLTVLASFPIAWFFSQPILVPLLAVLSISFVLSALHTVPYAICQRELRFDLQARFDALFSIVMGVATVSLAAAGAGVWALALGPIIGQVASTAAQCYRYPVSFAKPTSGLRSVASLSKNLIADRIAFYVYINADTLIVGRVLGESSLGLYTLARSLGTIALEKVTVTTMRVAGAVLSAAQSDTAALRRYTLLLVEGLALATFPVSIGTVLVAPEFTRAILGSKWVGMTVVLELVALKGLFTVFTPVFSFVLLVLGEARYLMRVGVAAAVIVPVSLILGVQAGLQGVSVAWLMCAPVLSIPLVMRLRRMIDLSTPALMTAVWPGLNATILMAVAVGGFGLLLDGEMPARVMLAAKITLGAIAYGAALLAFHRRRLLSLWNGLALLRGKRQETETIPMELTEGATRAAAPTP